MAVEITMELSEVPGFDLDLEILQFVGIADHNQLKNRDLENQHPIGAIEGLDDKLKTVDKKLETSDKTIEKHGTALEEQGKSVKELLEFKEKINIATASTVEEVLQNG